MVILDKQKIETVDNVGIFNTLSAPVQIQGMPNISCFMLKYKKNNSDILLSAILSTAYFALNW